MKYGAERESRAVANYNENQIYYCFSSYPPEWHRLEGIYIYIYIIFIYMKTCRSDRQAKLSR